MKALQNKLLILIVSSTLITAMAVMAMRFLIMVEFLKMIQNRLCS